jgi:hypothetical protein
MSILGAQNRTRSPECFDKKYRMHGAPSLVQFGNKRSGTLCVTAHTIIIQLLLFDWYVKGIVQAIMASKWRGIATHGQNRPFLRRL